MDLIIWNNDVIFILDIFVPNKDYFMPCRFIFRWRVL